jgi:hypothetical protein
MINNYKNVKLKLLKLNAAICYNEICKVFPLIQKFQFY